MRRFFVTSLCALFTAALFTAFAAGTAWSQDDQGGTFDGVSVLGRGPVHEAFADPAVEKPAAAPVVPKRPPDPIEEMPPDQKPEGTNVQWIPGYWDWDEDREDFIWVSGVWRDIPPGREWVSGYWTNVEGGAQWVPGYWVEAGQAELQYMPPPPASLEAGPSAEAPGENYVYVPGCHIYRETRYVWRPGYWTAAYPGWCWMPARYVWTPLGYIFVNGHWDYALHRRGLLFAPVYIERSVWGRPGWRYRPAHVVLETALVSAFFVHPSRGHYYFGDYFDPRYGRRGFVPWVDFRIGRRVADPLFAQYRSQYREPDRWEKNLRATYAEQRRNEAARPPVDFKLQKASGRDDVRHMLAPLSKLDRSGIKLTQVPQSGRDEAIKRIQDRTKAVEERQRSEIGDPKNTNKQPTSPDRPRTVRRTLTQYEEKSPRRVDTPQGPKTPGPKDGPSPKSEPKAPKADPNLPKTEPKTPKLEPKIPKSDPNLPKTEPKTPKTEPKFPKSDPKSPKTEPKFPKTEPTIPKSEPKTPRSEPKSPKTEPKFPKTEPTIPKSEPKVPKAEPKIPRLEPTVPKSEPKIPKTGPRVPMTEPKVPRKAEPKDPPPQPKALPVQPKSEPRPQPKAEPKPQPRSEPRPQPKAEPKPPPKVELPPPKSDSKPKTEKEKRP